MPKRKILNFISPSFTHEKLESPTYEDLLDVFEDRVRNWFLLPASKLLETRNCDIAAVALLSNYFESIEIYISGEDSQRRSAKFFARGFGRVFAVQNQKLSAKIAAVIYDRTRCGFAHDGIFRNRVFFSFARPDPILVTWPKKDGVFVESGELESIVINPTRFYESIQLHFDRYMKRLREGADTGAGRGFLKAVSLKWALGEADRAVGMTEDEFFRA
jgi:hypothetical protein